MPNAQREFLTLLLARKTCIPSTDNGLTEKKMSSSANGEHGGAKILVTGVRNTYGFDFVFRSPNFFLSGKQAAGFLGSNLVDFLLEKGNTVIGLDNLQSGSLQTQDHLKDHPRYEFFK